MSWFYWPQRHKPACRQTGAQSGTKKKIKSIIPTNLLDLSFGLWIFSFFSFLLCVPANGRLSALASSWQKISNKKTAIRKIQWPFHHNQSYNYFCCLLCGKCTGFSRMICNTCITRIIKKVKSNSYHLRAKLALSLSLW